jgi:hypothetical protein
MMDAGIHRVDIHIFGVLVGALTLAACTSSAPSAVTSPGESAAASAPTIAATVPVSPSPAAIVDSKRCPVTLPRHTGPAGARQAFFGWGASYGNGELWVVGCGRMA